MHRDELIASLAARIGALHSEHVTRVAIDGIDAAGKTTLANELAEALSGREIIRASIDGFHNPKSLRKDYYRDSFNYEQLIQQLLEPLGRGEDYCERVFDFRTDSPVPRVAKRARPDAILLFDGVFLLRPELLRYWDFTIFLRISFGESLRRAESRDVALFGSKEEVRARYTARYIPGQRVYLSEAEPERNASVVIDNENPSAPSIVR